jgi:tetratricopeptide (TPR) repeat protein
MKLHKLALFPLLIMPAWGCLNLDEQDLQGQHVTVSEVPEPSWTFSDSADRWRDNLMELDQRPESVETRNDRGVCLAHLGRARESLAIFEQIEKETPGRYETATNMGTCYELVGDNRQALTWIKEGIRRNPNSHEATEWLHVKILEAKLALARDPGWLKTHSVLGYDFGREPRPQIPRGLESKSEQARVRKALEYQLSERVPLVPPPDAIVGDLLFDLGNLRAIDTSVQRGQVWLDYSLQYQPPQIHLARRRIAYLHELAPVQDLRPNRSSAKTEEYDWQSVLAVCSILMLLGLYKRLRS